MEDLRPSGPNRIGFFAPPPSAPVPLPAWASSEPPRRSGRRGLVGLIAVGVSAAVVSSGVTALATGAFDPAPARLTGIVAAVQPASAAELAASEAEQQPDPEPTAGQVDLRRAGVFVQSNAVSGNEIVAFARNGDGTLAEVGRFPTGGTGTGSFEDSSHGLVLGSSSGESSPTRTIQQTQLLYALNAGSGSITVFKVGPDRLEKVFDIPSGGNRPVSLTVSGGLLYVLNSGEVDRRLLLGPTTARENCGHGDKPMITAFRVSPAGALTPIPDSTRGLSDSDVSGCAQVSFTPDGAQLVVTERLAAAADGIEQARGRIHTFEVREDGTLGTQQSAEPAGSNPFGFTFTRSGVLLTTEQNGGYANPGGGEAAAYRIGVDGAIDPLGPAVPNGATDTCWIVVTDDGRFAFASSPFDGGTISTYSVGTNGVMTLVHPAATAPDGADPGADLIPDGATDLALSSDDRFVYQLNSFDGTLWTFAVEPDGRLTRVADQKVFDIPPFGQGGEAAPFGLVAV